MAFVNHKDCGLRSNNFIVSGTEAEANEFPFIVSLQNKLHNNVSSHYCAGSILNDHWILTAKHCIKSDKPLDNLIIIAGTNDKTKPFKKYKAQLIIEYACYNEQKTFNDIALIKTNEIIEIDNVRIGTICMPPNNAKPVIKDMEIAGWGAWTEATHLIIGGHENSPNMLQKGQMQLYPESYCQHYAYFRMLGFDYIIPNWILGTMICLRSEEIGACRVSSLFDKIIQLIIFIKNNDPG